MRMVVGPLRIMDQSALLSVAWLHRTALHRKQSTTADEHESLAAVGQVSLPFAAARTGLWEPHVISLLVS
jgi:hypothetical protein